MIVRLKSFESSNVRSIKVKIFAPVAPDSRLIWYPVRGSTFLLICGMPTPDFNGVRSATWILQFDLRLPWGQYHRQFCLCSKSSSLLYSMYMPPPPYLARILVWYEEEISHSREYITRFGPNTTVPHIKELLLTLFRAAEDFCGLVFSSCMPIY
jgi:hypothetical protein